MNTWLNIYIKFKIVAHITCAMYRREGIDGREYVRGGKTTGGNMSRWQNLLEGICPGCQKYVCYMHFKILDKHLCM